MDSVLTIKLISGDEQATVQDGQYTPPIKKNDGGEKTLLDRGKEPASTRSSSKQDSVIDKMQSAFQSTYSSLSKFDGSIQSLTSSLGQASKFFVSLLASGIGGGLANQAAGSMGGNVTGNALGHILGGVALGGMGKGKFNFPGGPAAARGYGFQYWRNLNSQKSFLPRLVGNLIGGFNFGATGPAITGQGMMFNLGQSISGGIGGLGSLISGATGIGTTQVARTVGSIVGPAGASAIPPTAAAGTAATTTATATAAATGLSAVAIGAAAVVGVFAALYGIGGLMIKKFNESLWVYSGAIQAVEIEAEYRKELQKQEQARRYGATFAAVSQSAARRNEAWSDLIATLADKLAPMVEGINNILTILFKISDLLLWLESWTPMGWIEFGTRKIGEYLNYLLSSFIAWWEGRENENNAAQLFEFINEDRNLPWRMGWQGWDDIAKNGNAAPIKINQGVL